MKLLESKYATPRLYIGISSEGYDYGTLRKMRGVGLVAGLEVNERNARSPPCGVTARLSYRPMPIPSSSISGKAGTEIGLELAEDAICWRTWPESSEV